MVLFPIALRSRIRNVKFKILQSQRSERASQGKEEGKEKHLSPNRMPAIAGRIATTQRSVVDAGEGHH